MVKPMKLRGYIKLEQDRTLTFHGALYDGTPLSLTADQFDVELNENFLPSKMTVEGWLFVQQESQQDTRVYITLPKPHITFGRHVIVKSFDLMPRHATIASFNPTTKPGIAIENKAGS